MGEGSVQVVYSRKIYIFGTFPSFGWPVLVIFLLSFYVSILIVLLPFIVPAYDTQLQHEHYMARVISIEEPCTVSLDYQYCRQMLYSDFTKKYLF